jgi:hypothetical protein
LGSLLVGVGVFGWSFMVSFATEYVLDIGGKLLCLVSINAGSGVD